MSVEETLERLAEKAKSDPAVCRALLATREAKDPLASFCALSEELGCPLAVIDLAMAGEELYTMIRRGTNGGGENSPMLAGEDDYYGMFLARIAKFPGAEG